MKHAALLVGVLLSMGASHRTQNFIVDAPTAESASEIAEEAERLRRELAIEWTGTDLPDWYEPCPIVVSLGDDLQPSGQTSFVFRGRHPVRWRMYVQGSRDSIRDSVLPHEITHTIFATYFGRPLPRWAEEGACVTVEHFRERRPLEDMLAQDFSDERLIEVHQLFEYEGYPRDVQGFYAQGYSLVRFLLDRGGRRKFVQFLGDGMSSRDWPTATATHYGYPTLASLQNDWLAWAEPR